MKNIYSLMMLIVSFCINSAMYAQNTKEDSDLTSALKDLNISAKANLKVFKKDLSIEFNMPEEKIDQLMTNKNMQPADVYMTLQVAKQSGKKVDDVADSFEKNKGKGWGAIAKEMGIKPGSKEFHALKDGAKGKSKKMKDDKNKGKGNGKGNGKGKGK